MAEAPDSCPRSDRLPVIHRLEDGVLALTLGAMIVLSVSQIVLRNLFDAGWSWADPLLRILVLWVGLLGALVAGRRNQHISIDVLARVLPPRGRRAVQVVVGLFTAVVCGVVAWHGGRFVVMDFKAHVPGPVGIPSWTLEGVIPVVFGVLAVRYMVHAWRAIWRPAPVEERRHWR